MDDVAKQVTQLWEAGDTWRDVMPASDAHELVRAMIGGGGPRQDAVSKAFGTSHVLRRAIG